jgi:hypothetical protein
MKSLWQLPKSAGRSRQGEPIRAILSAASINRRLCAEVTHTDACLVGQHYLNLRSFAITQKFSGHFADVWLCASNNSKRLLTRLSGMPFWRYLFTPRAQSSKSLWYPRLQSLCGKEIWRSIFFKQGFVLTTRMRKLSMLRLRRQSWHVLVGAS